MALLKMGVIGTSNKEDEWRVPIHPEHLKRHPEHIRRQLIFEKGYGARFNISDEEMSTSPLEWQHEVSYYPI